MKIKKTKQEKKTEAVEQSKKDFDVIIEKVEKFGELKLEFDRNDFKKSLSTPYGFGFQDMKRVSRLTITECVKKYDVKFTPLFCGGSLGLEVKITKK